MPCLHPPPFSPPCIWARCITNRRGCSISHAKRKQQRGRRTNSWSRRKRKSSIIDYLPLLLSLFPLFSRVLSILTVLVLLQLGNKNMFIPSEIVVKREWGTHLATGQGRRRNAKSAGPFNRRFGPQSPTPLGIFTRPITIA